MTKEYGRAGTTRVLATSASQEPVLAKSDAAATLAPPPAFSAGFGSRESWRESALVLVPVLLLALAAIPYRYDLTLAEPDLVRMMVGLVYGAVTGLADAAGKHYGISFSFGYYKLLYALVPDAWLRDPDFTAALINRFGVVAGLMCVWTCTIYLRKLVGLETAIAASLMFFLSPVVLPIALSGHPLMAAAACLFAGGWAMLKAQEERDGGSQTFYFALAWLLLLGGLSLRAEIVLAFPFLWLASAGPYAEGKAWWRIYVYQALVLGAAFGGFLILQHGYVAAAGGAATTLRAFLDHFNSISRIGRGIVVLILSTGMVTFLAAAFAARHLSWRSREFLLLLVLAVPACLLWLPNPQPARHFFFVVLAICLLVAARIGKSQRSIAFVLACSLGVVVGNQVVAELVRPLVVSQYAWSYQLLTPRRATQQVPIGAFPLDQRANQAFAALERDEARRLAESRPHRLLVFADIQSYMIAHLLASDPSLEWTVYFDKTGIRFTELQSRDRMIVMVRKNDVWPRDVTAEVLADERWRQWPVYVQPTTVSRYDRTGVPPGREYRLP